MDTQRFRKFARLFPFALDAKPCPECAEDGETVYMESDHVREPALQDHWRGIEAWVCPGCDHAVEKDDDVDAQL